MSIVLVHVVNHHIHVVVVLESVHVVEVHAKKNEEVVGGVGVRVVLQVVIELLGLLDGVKSGEGLVLLENWIVVDDIERES